MTIVHQMFPEWHCPVEKNNGRAICISCCSYHDILPLGLKETSGMQDAFEMLWPGDLPIDMML